MDTDTSEKKFEYFPVLPREIRMMVNDEMLPNDRCRLTRCSTTCFLEVRKSKKYIYGLKLDATSAQSPTIYLYYYNQALSEVKLEFRTEFGRKYMKYSLLIGSERWRIYFPSSTDLVQLACEYMKKLLQAYHEAVKSVTIQGVNDYNFEIPSLRNLEELKLGTTVDNIQEIVSNTRRPLKSLEYQGQIDLDAYDYLRRVQTVLILPNMSLDYEQFRQLSASYIGINTEKLSENDIVNFIKSWQNGQVRENLQHCWWYTFDIDRFWQLLGVEPIRFVAQEFNFVYRKESSQMAVISYDTNNRVLSFTVLCQPMPYNGL